MSGPPRLEGVPRLRAFGPSERGQAVSETLMLSWMLIVFIAAAHQVFLMNETIFRSITAVHQDIFKTAYRHNCARSREECTYDGGDLRAKAIWTPDAIPEIAITRVGMFRRYGMRGDLRLTSNSPLNIGSLMCPDCKRTKLGAGAYQSQFTTLAKAASALGSGGFGLGGGGLFGMIGGALGQLGLGENMNLPTGQLQQILDGPQLTPQLQMNIQDLTQSMTAAGGLGSQMNALMQQAATAGLATPR